MTIHQATLYKQTALYRLYAAGNTLLYVGVTHTPDKRFAEHAYERDWWPEVERKSLTWYPSRPEAEAAEIDAIASEHPRHNVMRGGITTDWVAVLEAQRVAKAKQEQAKAKTDGDSPTPGQSSCLDDSPVSHEHQLTPHHHVGAWCSGRYWCEGCKSWFDGPPCKGAKAAKPTASSVALAR